MYIMWTGPCGDWLGSVCMSILWRSYDRQMRFMQRAFHAIYMPEMRFYRPVSC